MAVTKFSFFTFQHQTAVISHASSRSPCSIFILTYSHQRNKEGICIFCSNLHAFRRTRLCQPSCRLRHDFQIEKIPLTHHYHALRVHLAGYYSIINIKEGQVDKLLRQPPVKEKDISIDTTSWLIRLASYVYHNFPGGSCRELL